MNTNASAGYKNSDLTCFIDWFTNYIYCHIETVAAWNMAS